MTTSISYDKFGTTINGTIDTEKNIFTGEIIIFKNGVEILNSWGEHSLSQLIIDHNLNLIDYI